MVLPDTLVTDPTLITFIFVNNKTRNVKKSTKQNTNISFLDFFLYFSKEIIKIYINKQENTIIVKANDEKKYDLSDFIE